MTSSTVCWACAASANASMIMKMSARTLSPFTFDLPPLASSLSPLASRLPSQPPLPRQLTARRILAVKLRQLRVHRGISLAHDVGDLEEGLAHHCEKFPRRLGCVRIDVGVFAGFHAPAEILVGLSEHPRPRLPAHAGVQRRKPVGIAVEH